MSGNENSGSGNKKCQFKRWMIIKSNLDDCLSSCPLTEVSLTLQLMGKKICMQMVISFSDYVTVL